MKKMEAENNNPCAACKSLGRKCEWDCVFAQYFPSNQPDKFAKIHQVFGCCNVANVLNSLDPSNRQKAVDSLLYDAEAIIGDPVHGSVSEMQFHYLRLAPLSSWIFRQLSAKEEPPMLQQQGIKNPTWMILQPVNPNNMQALTIVRNSYPAGGRGQQQQWIIRDEQQLSGIQEMEIHMLRNKYEREIASLRKGHEMEMDLLRQQKTQMAYDQREQTQMAYDQNMIMNPGKIDTAGQQDKYISSRGLVHQMGLGVSPDSALSPYMSQLRPDPQGTLGCLQHQQMKKQKQPHDHQSSQLDAASNLRYQQILQAQNQSEQLKKNYFAQYQNLLQQTHDHQSSQLDAASNLRYQQILQAQNQSEQLKKNYFAQYQNLLQQTLQIQAHGNLDAQRHRSQLQLQGHQQINQPQYRPHQLQQQTEQAHLRYQQMKKQKRTHDHQSSQQDAARYMLYQQIMLGQNQTAQLGQGEQLQQQTQGQHILQQQGQGVVQLGHEGAQQPKHEQSGEALDKEDLYS